MTASPHMPGPTTSALPAMTGQPFSEAYRRDVLGDRTRLFDSGPATLALTAVALTAPDREFEALQGHPEGPLCRRPRQHGCLPFSRDVLRALGLHDAADRLAAPDDDLIAAYRKRIEAARAEMRRFGADGVPALIVGVGENRRLVGGSASSAASKPWSPG